MARRGDNILSSDEDYSDSESSVDLSTSPPSPPTKGGRPRREKKLPQKLREAEPDNLSPELRNGKCHF